MKKIILLTILSFTLFGCNYVIVDADKVNEEYALRLTKVAEEAYFEGQRDYLNGDIHIEKIADSTYIWIKSPWNSGEEPIFNPKLKKY
jgi:hypothetical protein